MVADSYAHENIIQSIHSEWEELCQNSCLLSAAFGDFTILQETSRIHLIIYIVNE